MRKIKDIISKPSEALQAMVDGLLEQDARPDFVVNMDTYGGKKIVGNGEKYVCFGCAATCTVQKIIGINFTYLDIDHRCLYIDIRPNDLHEFEVAIDYARRGIFGCLFAYFDVDWYGIRQRFTTGNFNIENHNWRQELPKVTAHIKLLQEAGY